MVPVTGLGTPTPGAPSLVNVTQTSSLGPILVDGAGLTLYLFTMDTANTSTCYGSCAAIWLPYLTDGTPTAGSGVNAALLSSTTRTDGSSQVTYNGHPLYYFAKDKAPGETTGEGVQNVWYRCASSFSKREKMRRTTSRSGGVSTVQRNAPRS